MYEAFYMKEARDKYLFIVSLCKVDSPITARSGRFVLWASK